jgi:hypothetical protein
MTKKTKLRDFDPIESKKRKKNKELENKFDPSRKNKKYYLKTHEYV